MTLLEMTAVILVLLSLISLLFIGARAWKRGSDRTLCILQIGNVQQGVRSYSNLYGYAPGEMVPNLQGHVIGLGKFLETSPICPTSGSYTFGEEYGPDTIPPTGTLYMKCSLSASIQHEPQNFAQW